MKTCIFRFPSGFWGVRCRIRSGEWVLYSVSCANKEMAIEQARTAAYYMPSGRLYQEAKNSKQHTKRKA